MQLSTDRILTTHAGSLPRAPALTALLADKENGRPVDAQRLRALADEGVREVVRRQAAAGIDVASDGEQPRTSYMTYVTHRMSGFGGESKRAAPRDLLDFPDYMERHRKIAAALSGGQTRIFNAPQAIGPVRYEDPSAAADECAMFRAALDAEQPPFAETFVTAASPGVISFGMANAHYPSHADYVMALADAMRTEYELIHRAGFLLQLDCPDFANEYSKGFWDQPVSAYQAILEVHVEAINRAVANIPREAVRLHVCYGNYEGPHTRDIALADILPIVCRARVGALQIEFANPRHQHELRAVREIGLAPEIALIPGVIDTTTNFVEHPEVVAERLLRAVEAVGDRERVLAGTDCGFSTFAGVENVARDVVWAKLAALAEGARLASRTLWGRG